VGKFVDVCHRVELRLGRCEKRKVKDDAHNQQREFVID